MCLPLKPYKIEHEWEHAGLKCAVVQSREKEHRCGYVRVPPGHPLHGKSYDDPNVDVHGGLTFAAVEPCAHEDGVGYWFGFDCHHWNDSGYDPAYPPDHILRMRELHPNLFDYRGEHFWTHEEVVAETERLAEQLAKYHQSESEG